MAHLPAWFVPLIVGLVCLRLLDDHLKKTQRANRRRKYREYLRTPGWQSRREVAVATAAQRWQDCKRETDRFDVHHITYRRVGRERPRDLVALCHDCHMSRHKRHRR
jgi:hypothetical protein